MTDLSVPRSWWIRAYFFHSMLFVTSIALCQYDMVSFNTAFKICFTAVTFMLFTPHAFLFCAGRREIDKWEEDLR